MISYMLLSPHNIAIALITFYPRWYRGRLQSISQTDKIRGDLALKFIQQALSQKYQVVVVDGYSSRSFRRELDNFSNLKVLKRRSNKRSPAKRQALKAASKLPGAKVIITTEAEKTSLIDSIATIVQPIFENNVDIIVPKRENNLFRKTYPDYMYDSEVEGNKIYNFQLKLYRLLPESSDDLDMFFGPKAIKNDSKILSLFNKVFNFKFEKNTPLAQYLDTEEYSNALFFPIISALKKRLRVKSVEILFHYPAIQKQNESAGARELFINKRQAQRLGILVELMYLLNYLQDK